MFLATDRTGSKRLVELIVLSTVDARAGFYSGIGRERADSACVNEKMTHWITFHLAILIE
jgi:hypothetical protein